MLLLVSVVASCCLAPYAVGGGQFVVEEDWVELVQVDLHGPTARPDLAPLASKEGDEDEDSEDEDDEDEDARSNVQMAELEEVLHKSSGSARIEAGANPPAPVYVGVASVTGALLGGILSQATKCLPVIPGTLVGAVLGAGSGGFASMLSTIAAPTEDLPDPCGVIDVQAPIAERRANQARQVMGVMKNNVTAANAEKPPPPPLPGTPPSPGSESEESDAALAPAAAPSGQMYYAMDANACCCPDGLAVGTIAECREAVEQLGLLSSVTKGYHDQEWVDNRADVVPGCSWKDADTNDMHWNTHPIGAGGKDLQPICKVDTTAPANATDILKQAQKVIADNFKTQKSDGMAEEDLVSSSNVSDMLTADVAASNGALITASDVAEAAGGMRGEDDGTAGTSEVFQGDMVPANDSQLLLFQTGRFGHQFGFGWVGAGQPWTDGEVKYCFASDIDPHTKNVFLAAVNQYTRAVPNCLTFTDVGWTSGKSTDDAQKQACKTRPAIFVMSNPKFGCYSYVGMIPSYKSQQLQLQHPGCTSIGTAVHELGHALGHAHEHARPDREKYLDVFWDNIEAKQYHNFDISTGAFTGVPYDYMSVMHYDAFAFAKDKSRPTLKAKPIKKKARRKGRKRQAKRAGGDGLGQRVGLSSTDIKQTVAMYKDVAKKCKASNIAGMGCVDKVDDDGNDICSGIQTCTDPTIHACCACGGGLAVQCYKGRDCPDVKRLPPPPDRMVLVETLKYPGYDCLIKNNGEEVVALQCPDQAACCQKIVPGGPFQLSCNGEVLKQICEEPEKCKASTVCSA